MKSASVVLLLALVACAHSLPSLEKIYSVWFCGDDSCLWASQPKADVGWLLNRGDGKPTVNLIIFAFIDPLELLNGRVPAGFTQSYVDMFKSHNIYVSFSIGGASFASNWDQALSRDAAGLARNAAKIAKQYGVGIEIDYETDSSQSMAALTTFVKTYRSVIPYEGGNTPSAPSLLTVDEGAGTGYLSALSATAAGWLNSSLVNWANAMVAGDPNGDATQYWQQHLTGAGWAGIPPMSSHQLVGCLYASSGSNNCPNYQGSLLPNSINWLNSHNARGLSFWAAGCPAGPNQCANNCPGIQQGSKSYLG